MLARRPVRPPALRALACGALAVCVALAACADARPAAPLPHEVYVWQRAWTPAVVDAVQRTGPSFAGVRVLAAEIGKDGAPEVLVTPAAAALAGQRVVLVVRVDGATPIEAADLARVVDAARARFAAAGVGAGVGAGAGVSGVEIDHDCATRRLPAYAASLAALRAHLARGAGDAPALSITALPAWSAAPALDDVLAAVDHVVLQVHAVDAPSLARGAIASDARASDAGASDVGGSALFAPARARAFVDAFAPRAAEAGVPWRVAVPAYGHALLVDARGAVVRVVSEPLLAPPSGGAGTRVVEVEAAPADVAAFLRTLDDARPPLLAGVVWFRLPVDGDRRAWSAATLAAVRAGADLAPRLRVELRPSRPAPPSQGGARAALHDVVVVNEGLVAAPAPARVPLDVVGLVAADGANGFAFDPPSSHASRSGRALTSPHPPRVAPGGALVVGWVRAQEVHLHGSP